MNKLFAIIFALFFLLLGKKTYSEDFHQKESFIFPVSCSFNQRSQLKIIQDLFSPEELNDLNIEVEISKNRNIILTEINEEKRATIYFAGFHSSFFTLITDLPPPTVGE